MKKFLPILLGVAFSAMMTFGCAVEAPAPPGVPFATQIVWQQQYVMGDALPPVVYWVVGDALNCADGQGWAPAPSKYTLPPCVAGLYYQDEKTAYVAWPNGTRYISDTSFAHELCHAFMWATTGDGDENHVGPCYTLGGYVQIANEALVRVDL